MSMIIPLVNLKRQYSELKDEVDQAIREVVDSQHFIGGPKVEEFEAAIADFCGVKFAVGVNSGTDALFLALKALGLGFGDEVITASWTFIATARAIVMTGAKPVFADIDTGTYNIDPVSVKEKVTPRTRAIVPVHLYGQCADMDSILDVAKHYGLYVVEDAAQAMGATYKGKPAGSMGDMGCSSFYPSKNLGGYGDGGVVLTDKEKYAQRIRDLRCPPEGVNSRLDAIQAAVLLVKLPHLDAWNRARRHNAAFYKGNLERVVHPYVPSSNEHTYHQYVVRMKPGLRDKMIEYVAEKGIESRVYYPTPVHQQPGFPGPHDCPRTEMAAEATLALPVSQQLKLQEMNYIVDIFNAFGGWETD